MPKITHFKHRQAQGQRPADQGRFAGTNPYGASVSGYTQTGFDNYASYQGYSSNTYNAAAYAADDFYQDDAGAAAQKKRGAGFYVGISMVAIALVAAIATGMFLFMNSTQIIPTHRSGELGQLDGKTKEEIQAELDRIVEEGMFNIAIANTIQLPNGSSEGDFSIENSSDNRYNMQLEIALADTGEVIYTSGILEPNYHIQYAKLDTPLEKGTYSCVATFHALDPDKDDAEVGQASAAITIVVVN